MTKIDDEIKECLSEIIRFELSDPRVNNSLVSIIKTKTSKDLEHCLVSISILDKNKNDIIKILNKAQGYIRKLVANKINLRVTPNFKFILDDSIEYSEKINALLNKLS
jgi:ribosome-binding factor A